MLNAQKLVKSLGLLLAAAMVMPGILLTATPTQAAPLIRDGSNAATAAGSCWEIKQNNPATSDGTYWLLTPAMDAPAQFYCDMTTDGGGWVLIGKGREGWQERNGGTGTQSALRTSGVTPMSGATTQMPAETVNALINGQRPDSLQDGIRLKRATTADGSQWQESRFNTAKMDRWVWTFGAEHQVAWYSFNGVRGTGGLTSNFGTDTSLRRVTVAESPDQGYTIGFAYGSSIQGTNDTSTYLWSETNGLGSARPYTEVYLRPRVLSSDAGFTRIADAGTPVKTNVPVANSFALNSPWGVTAAVSPKREGDVETQAFVQSGNTMYVGGNFTSVQRAANSTGTDKVAQSFLAAFDVSTGELVRTFKPQLNGSVMSLAVLPNGNIVAGGMFTSANGSPVPAFVALDPATGATATKWKVNIENRQTSGVLRVSALSVQGDWLYLGGAFTHLSGGSKPDTVVYARGAARVSVSTGTPDGTWNPEFNGTVVAIDAARDGGRLYAAGYFTTSRTAAAFKAAAVNTSAGASLATPVWSPVWSNTNKNYQQAIHQVGDRVWVGGSEHSLFSYSKSTFDRLSGNIGKKNGDFQAIGSSGTGIVYGGSHGHDWNYSNAFTWSNVGTQWTQADSFEWVGAWDAASGDIVPTFTPSMKFRLGQGIWAVTVDSQGTMWAGGDMTTVATNTKAGQWSGGFARFPQIDATAPTTPGNAIKSSDGTTTVKLAWNSATDSGGSVSYQILRNDRVIATTTSTNLTVPKGGEDRFYVRAVDAAGNLSPSSAVIVAAPTPVNKPPTASFTQNLNNLDIAVDGSASTDSDGTIASYKWDFGDGGSATGVTANRTYAAAGNYTVTLTVTDNDGATNAKSIVVTATAAPKLPVDTVVVAEKSSWTWRYSTTAPAATWKDSGSSTSGWASGPAPLGFGSTGLGTNIDVPPPTSGRPLAAYFVKQFTVDSVADVRKLSLGTVANDGIVVYVNGTEVGRSNMPEGDVTFNTYASSAVRSTVANDNPVTFLVPTGLLVTGANTIAVETHINYRATADMGFDLSATLSTGGTVKNENPIAQFSSVATDLSVAFDAGDTYDTDGAISSYSWDFGDGTTGDGVKITHLYQAAATYTVTLTAQDNEGAISSVSHPLTVTRKAGPVDDTVIPAKSAWSWRYASGAPDSDWKSLGFDASTWTVGAGVLGFGSTGIGTNIDVPPPVSSRPLAAYYISQFNLSSASKVSKLVLNTVADDGAVVYVNGVEVGRRNMPAGTVTSGTYASTAISTSKANADPMVIDVPVQLLVDGINVVAVETHLNYRATADVSFDMKAVATLVD